MNYFSVPADFKKSTIDGYYELNKKYPDAKVKETYGQISVDNKFESGRVNESLPKVDYFTLQEYVRYSQRKSIDFNYTLNAPYMHNKEFSEKGIKEIKGLLYQLHKESDC